MAKIAVFFADGCEEIEGLTVVDMLRRAKLDVVSVSVTGSLEIHGSHNITFLTDTTYEQAAADEEEFERTFDGIVLPGGVPGTQNLGAHKGVTAAVKNFAASGRLVAAICAAPSVLGENGVLQGKRATCHPGWEDKLAGAVLSEENAVTDGNIITSRGMGTAVDFSLAIIRKLAGEDAVEQVKKGIVY